MITATFGFSPILLYCDNGVEQQKSFFSLNVFTQLRENLFGNQDTVKNLSFWGKMILLIYLHFNHVINRPGVAGAVLQSPLSLIDYLIN